MQCARIHVKYVWFTIALFQLNNNDARRLTDRNFEFIEVCGVVACFQEQFLQGYLYFCATS
jgi:hypothetical protein